MEQEVEVGGSTSKDFGDLDQFPGECWENCCPNWGMRHVPLNFQVSVGKIENSPPQTQRTQRGHRDFSDFLCASSVLSVPAVVNGPTLYTQLKILSQ